MVRDDLGQWVGLRRTTALTDRGTISALSSGLLTLHPNGANAASSSRTVPSPLLAISSPGPDSTTFALAGKEVDVSVWDVERTFGSAAPSASTESGKRKKNELEAGELWRAKNVSGPVMLLRWVYFRARTKRGKGSILFSLSWAKVTSSAGCSPPSRELLLIPDAKQPPSAPTAKPPSLPHPSHSSRPYASRERDEIRHCAGIRYAPAETGARVEDCARGWNWKYQPRAR